MSSKNRKRILYIVQHRFNRSPGQRYRCEQYMAALEAAGFECVYSPLQVNSKEDDELYYGTYFQKLMLFTKGAFRRMKDVIRANKFDIVFIYREAFMTGTTVFEKLVKRSGAKIVFDFDDAIWKHDISEGNKGLGWLKRPEKTDDIISLADLVFAGNEYLAQYARRFNKEVVIIPSTIDLDYYRVPPKVSSDNIVTIGWTGSLTTIEHFKTIIPVLKSLKEKFADRIAFKVLGVPQYVNAELGIQGIKWTHETEVRETASFDIGIMPLPDNEWSRGKCGMKGLQYMALEVATVMSAVGVNKDIIKDGENGFLTSSDEEWVEKLSLLIDSKDLRNKLGKAGRKTVEEKYSSAAIKNQYLRYFEELVAENKFPNEK
jgi:glycosyltransferase involved in cell wall biosynthesis